MIAIDSNVWIAMSDPGHFHHSRSFALVDRLASGDEPILVSLHSLFEIYSVITRLPLPFRQTPEAVWNFLNATVRPIAKIASASDDPWSILDAVKSRSAAGGRIYDALIAHSVASAGATTLYTWNVRDMLRVAPPGLYVREPSLAE